MQIAMRHQRGTGVACYGIKGTHSIDVGGMSNSCCIAFGIGTSMPIFCLHSPLQYPNMQASIGPGCIHSPSTATPVP